MLPAGAQEIITLELKRLLEKAQQEALSLDEARKVVLYIRLPMDPLEEDNREPFADVPADLLREVLKHVRRS